MLSEKQREDKKILARHIFKLQNFKANSAVDALLNVDYIKNNYSANTLKSYFQLSMAYLKYGTKSKALPDVIREELENQKKTCQGVLTPKAEDKTPVTKPLSFVAKTGLDKINMALDDHINEVKRIEEELKSLDKKKKDLENELKAKQSFLAGLSYATRLIRG